MQLTSDEHGERILRSKERSKEADGYLGTRQVQHRSSFGVFAKEDKELKGQAWGRGWGEGEVHRYACGKADIVESSVLRRKKAASSCIQEC